jgi:hypothetical protein
MCTLYNFTHSFCNIGRYEKASWGKCMMLFSDRSLKNMKYYRMEKETAYNMKQWQWWICFSKVSCVCGKEDNEHAHMPISPLQGPFCLVCWLNYFIIMQKLLGSHSVKWDIVEWLWINVQAIMAYFKVLSQHMHTGLTKTMTSLSQHTPNVD